MPRESFIGFDSAWADNPKAPGAIAGLVLDGAETVSFVPPQLATFAQGADLIEDLSAGCALTLIALDQPTLVPNQRGARPVERVAGAIMSSLRGGVQPAFRGKTGLFCDAAPIWPFLDRLASRQNPIAARHAAEGRFVLEVFPAMTLPALDPGFVERRRAAKYNPANRKQYRAEDWTAVARCVAREASSLGLAALAAWAADVAALANPRKADQDRLDAAICLLIAVLWRRAPAERVMAIGDARSGFIAAIVSDWLRTRLATAAEARGVPVVDAVWETDGDHRAI